MEIRKFDDIGEIFSGISVTSRNSGDEPIRQLRISDIDERKVYLKRVVGEELLVKNTSDFSRCELKEGDVVLSARGSMVKANVIGRLEKPLYVSSNFIVIRDLKDIKPEYVAIYINSAKFQRFIKRDVMSGKAVLMLSLKNFSNLDLPIIEREQQEQLVFKMLAASEYLEQCEDQFKKVHEYSKSLAYSYLNRPERDLHE